MKTANTLIVRVTVKRNKQSQDIEWGSDER